MGDADDLWDSGLKWGWDDNYPEFDEEKSYNNFPRYKASWKNRNPCEAILNEDVTLLANDLAIIKEKIKQLQDKEKEVKQKLMELMPLKTWIDVSHKDKLSNDYIVEHLSVIRKPRLNTSITLAFISKKYGREAALTVSELCSNKPNKNSTIYVRPFPKNKK